MPSETISGRVRRKAFDRHDHTGYNIGWWAGTITTDDDWLSVRCVGLEVARAKVQPGYRIGERYPVGNPPGGWANIDLIEVRADLRLTGYGTAAVAAIVEHYDGAPLAAFSKDETTDGFWRRLRWAEHRPVDDMGATLFLRD